MIYITLLVLVVTSEYQLQVTNKDESLGRSQQGRNGVIWTAYSPCDGLEGVRTLDPSVILWWAYIIAPSTEDKAPQTQAG